MTLYTVYRAVIMHAWSRAIRLHEYTSSINMSVCYFMQLQRVYRRLRSLSTGAYRSNSGGMGAKKRTGAY